MEWVSHLPQEKKYIPGIGTSINSKSAAIDVPGTQAYQIGYISEHLFLRHEIDARMRRERGH